TIDPGHGDVRLLVDGDINPGRNVEGHDMRVAEGENHLLALELRAVADADDVEVLAEAFGDTADRVRHQAAREAVELAELLVLTQRARVQLIAVDLESDTRRQRLAQLALRALHFDHARLNVNLDALRDGNELLANSHP